MKPLIKVLNNPKYRSYHRYVVIALGKLGDPRAVEPIIKGLERKGHFSPDRNSAEALGKLGDPRAVEILIEQLDGEVSCNVDENGEIEDLIDVRPAVIRSLGQIGDPRAVEPIIDKAMFKIHDDIDQEIHYLAIEALQSINDPRAVEILIGVLEKRKSAFKKSFAAKALGELGDARAVEPLVKVLEKSKSKDFRFFREVIGALGKIGGPRAAEMLIGALENSGSRYREYELSLVIALGDTRDPLAVELLAKLLNDQSVDNYVRECAARGLEQIGDLRAVAPLIQALEESTDSSILSKVISAMTSLKDPRTVEPLIKSLDNIHIPLNVFYALGWIGDPRAVEPLEKILAGEATNKFREEAAKSLGQINTPEAKNALINALSSVDDKAHQLQYTITLELEKIDDPLIVEPLGKLLCNDRAYEPAREEAARILGKTKNQLAVEPLIRALAGSRNSDCYTGIIWSLETLGDPRAVEPLEKELLQLDELDPEITNIVYRKRTIKEALLEIKRNN